MHENDRMGTQNAGSFCGAGERVTGTSSVQEAEKASFLLANSMFRKISFSGNNKTEDTITIAVEYSATKERETGIKLQKSS